MGASFCRKRGRSFGLAFPSIHRRYLDQFSKVFPDLAPHPASGAFVVRFPFIDNFLIDALVCFRPHRMSNLPRRCHRPFFLHLSLPSLLLLVVCLFLSRVLLFYKLCGNRRFRILEFPFITSCRAGGTAASKMFSFFEICFRSGYGPDCFQPFPIVDIFPV